jgi:cytoskeleton protein RodZ
MTEPATIGARLKAARERKGLSSQKAADELHLDGWVVDALEADDYARVGPAVYAKGHLKRYAALLGLPAVEVMTGYDTIAQTPKPVPAASGNMRLRADAPPVSNLPWTPILGVLAAVLLVGGVIWWKPWHQRGAGTAARLPAPSAKVNATGPHVDAAAAGAAGDSSGTAIDSGVTAADYAASAPTPTSASTATPAATDAPGAGRARLRLSFSADSWVDVHDAQGRRVYAGNGRANSVKTIAGMAPMRVYLGFASGVQLEIDNRAVAIGPQFVAGDVAHFEAGADGILRRDSHGSAAPAVPSRNVQPTG